MNATFTLKHLKYFLALIQHQHFGRAAEACFVTQPTLSAAIKELEESLGVRLFERTKRQVLVTPVGHQIAERAQEILLQAESLMDVARAHGKILSGPLNLGVIPTIAPYLLPCVMAPLRKEFPNLKLYLKEDQTARLLDQLKDGSLDVLILALPYESDAIESHVFMEDRFFVALPPKHPLADKDILTSQDIAREPLLLLEEGHCLREHALAACAWSASPRQSEFAATSLSTIVQMVASGLGITLLPQMAIDAGITTGSGLKPIALSDASPARQIGLVWRSTSGRSDEFRKLARFLSEIL